MGIDSFGQGIWCLFILACGVAIVCGGVAFIDKVLKRIFSPIGEAFRVGSQSAAHRMGSTWRQQQGEDFYRPGDEQASSWEHPEDDYVPPPAYRSERAPYFNNRGERREFRN